MADCDSYATVSTIYRVSPDVLRQETYSCMDIAFLASGSETKHFRSELGASGVHSRAVIADEPVARASLSMMPGPKVLKTALSHSPFLNIS